MAEVLIKYIDRDDDEWELQADDSLGGGVVPEHSVVKSVLPAGAATSANQTTTHTKLDTIIAAVADLDGNTDGLEAKLDSIIAALNPAFCISGQNTDIDGVSEDLGSQACPIGAWVKNISTSLQDIYVSPNNVTATLTNGYKLAVGDERFFPCRDISELKVIASAANAAASWLAI